MGGPQRRGWLERPQLQPLRRALFQIHLWLGIATGLYVVLISVSGSAVVFRRELNLWLVPHHVSIRWDRILTKDDLRAAASARYPGYTVRRVSFARALDRPAEVELVRGTEVRERLFDPYTGRDLGDSFPRSLRAVEWLVSLHDDLLAGETGRRWNGLGGLLVLGLVLSGGVIWWPGRRRWSWSVAPRRGPKAPRVMWQLHSLLGFWSLALLAIWAVTGIYFAFPEPFDALMNLFDSNKNDFVRPGEAVLLALIRLHFGRFGGLSVRVLWTVLGLLPAVLFVTGFTLWWRRVVRRRLAPPGSRAAAAARGGAAPAVRREAALVGAQASAQRSDGALARPEAAARHADAALVRAEAAARRAEAAPAQSWSPSVDR